MFSPGDVLQGRYQIMEEISVGGTGIIFRAVDLHLQKDVVVKKIKTHLIERVDIRAEADVMKRLHHSYLPQVYDFIQVVGDVYTVMEFIEGHDLQYYLDCGITFPEKQLRKWLEQLCEALDYLHSLTPPILHCDIKPANIMITPQGNVCLIDFNVSLNCEGDVRLKGLSVWYSAPEQYASAMGLAYGVKPDVRMDIYSLGAAFYRVVTGNLPSPLEEEFCPIQYCETSCSDGLVHILAKAMERKPQKRYQSAALMLAALQNIRKQDRQWRYLRLKQIGLLASCGFMLTVGILSTWYGMRINGRENYMAAYQQFYEYGKNCQYEETVRSGIDLLNRREFSSFLARDPEGQGKILQQIAESYFFLEDYSQAENYYREAIALLPEDASCIRDYAVTLARQGKMSQALAVISEATTDEALLLVQAEICRQQEDFAGAISSIERLLAIGRDAETMSAGCRLTAEIWAQEKNYEKQVEALKQARSYCDAPDLQRAYAAALMDLAKSADEEKRETYLEDAIACYEELAAMPLADYVDVVNLAIALKSADRESEALDRLRELAEKDDSHYQVYGELSILEYEVEQEKVEGLRDYSQAYAHAEQAMELYQQEKEQPMDSMMDQVQRIVERKDGREQ